ncbi:malonyl-CoA synthase [Gymnodinialimonas sp. 2305UL16-5]|uniref:malonate--CoA ligase n=1 Tax=Gymnodinialimonas mytili TaxID=3126503 RepID=UPI0030B7D69E
MANHLIDALRAPSQARLDEILMDGGVTLGAFWHGVDQLSASLAACDVLPGDRVAVQVAKSVTALQLYLATVQIGGVFLPLNTAYTLDEVAYLVENAEPRVIVCDPSAASEMTARHTACRVETLGPDGTGSIVEDAPRVQPVARGPEDLAAILYTSGTTGRSKGAMLSHSALLSNSRTLAELWQFNASDTLIHALPIFHTHGLFVASNIALLSGARMVFLPGFDTDAILEAMPRATALMGVPTFYTRLLGDPRLDRARAANMRLFVSGSAPLLAGTHRQWEARTGHRILERYGMTETNMNTSNPYKGERRAGTVGFPLPDVELRIMGPGGPVEKGGIGGIEVRGPNVFSGYWRMPEKTAEELRPDGWFITGDLGQVDADGYITIVGRLKDLIISGGFNIYPKEVEEVLDDVPGILESAVIGVPHPDFGEGVVAVIVADGSVAIDERAVQAAVSDRLAKFKQPKRVFVVDALPRNTMGKVQKAALRAEYAAVFQVSNS